MSACLRQPSPAARAKLVPECNSLSCNSPRWAFITLDVTMSAELRRGLAAAATSNRLRRLVRLDTVGRTYPCGDHLIPQTRTSTPHSISHRTVLGASSLTLLLARACKSQPWLCFATITFSVYCVSALSMLSCAPNADSPTVNAQALAASAC